MGDQDIVTREEAELEERWYANLREQEQIIREAHGDKIDAMKRIIGAVWTTIVNGWYRPYHLKDENPLLDHDQNLEDWLGSIQAEGVIAIPYSTWRKIYETMVVDLEQGHTLDHAISLAAKSSDAVPKLRAAGAITVKAEDGSQFLTTGKKVVVGEGENFGLLGVPVLGDYLNKLEEMPSGRHISDTIRHDMKTPNISVTGMWEGQEAQGIKFRTFPLEILVEDEQGGVKYNGTLRLEKEMPVPAARATIRKLSQKFAHLAAGSSK